MEDQILYNSGIITGECTTRLNELKKYTITDDFSEQYVIRGSSTENNDGVDYNVSTPTNIIYYLGDIRFNDVIIDGQTYTTYSFISLGYASPDFFYSPVIKLPEKENMISNQKTENDVFISRQEISVFNNNFKLEYIKNLAELNSYAAGSFYNIVNNT